MNDLEKGRAGPVDLAFAAFEGNRADLPVDLEHSTDVRGAKGEPAPAVGWIKAIRVGGDGSIEGRIDWTDTGKRLIAARACRYLSPAVMFDRANRTIRRLTSAGLTNKPDFHMAALAREGEGAGTGAGNAVAADALGPVAAALGLDAGAGLSEIVAAASSARSPDPARFVPIEAAAKVDAAISGGCLPPAMRDWAVAHCRQDRGQLRGVPGRCQPGFRASLRGKRGGTGAKIGDRPGRRTGGPPAWPDRCRSGGLRLSRAAGATAEGQRKESVMNCRGKMASHGVSAPRNAGLAPPLVLRSFRWPPFGIEPAAACARHATANLALAAQLCRTAAARLETAAKALSTAGETGDKCGPNPAAAPVRRSDHRPGVLPRIDNDPELEAFIRARVDHMTFEQCAAAVADAFPPERPRGAQHHLPLVVPPGRSTPDPLTGPG